MENILFNCFRNFKSLKILIAIAAVILLIIGVDYIQSSIKTDNLELKVATREEFLHSLCRDKGFSCNIPETWQATKVLKKEDIKLCKEQKLLGSKCLSFINYIDAMEEFSKISNSHIQSLF